MAQTTASGFDKRWEQISIIWRDNRILFAVAGWFVGIVTPTLLYRLDVDFYSLFFDMIPETIGMLFTVFILNKLADNRTRTERIERLLHEAQSRSKDTAMSAIEWLYRDGLLFGKASRLRGKRLLNLDIAGIYLKQADLEGISFMNSILVQSDLQNANLRETALDFADLEGSFLARANLSKSTLRHTNMQGVFMANAQVDDCKLWETNLTDSNLFGINLENSSLLGANFHSCSLYNANLQNTSLRLTDFSSANLMGASFRGAELIEEAVFNTRTVLPDAKDIGTPTEPKYDKFWTPDTDMRQYIDPTHNDFWQPQWAVEKDSSQSNKFQ